MTIHVMNKVAQEHHTHTRHTYSCQ